MFDQKYIMAIRETLIWKYLARNESANSRIRMFRILHNKYMGSVSFHPKTFKAI